MPRSLRKRALLLPVALSTAACTWITEDEWEERLDVDKDGFLLTFGYTSACD